MNGEKIRGKEVKEKLDIPFDSFVEACDEYGIWHLKSNSSLYPMVMSNLSQEQNWRSERFEVIYLLCRGMWAVFLILLLLYLVSICLYVPIWITIRGPEVYSIDILPIIMLLSLALIALIFLIASKDYKKTMIGYVLSDFCVYVQSKEVGSHD
ncbi:hypothetical protein CP557_14235 [Natrinema ejinorense]|uniref:Uncharacterized protein n=2 Tax=Natrinema ejinorense TaxID=373386 RepID=A0A2A5QXS2_9EURY|nr:hypothetical protein CP557_14235 [Natrinema ejinorense]